jgi:hypothetical protein
MWIVLVEDMHTRELIRFAGVVEQLEDILEHLIEREDAQLERITPSVYQLKILTQRCGPLCDGNWTEREFSRTIACLVQMNRPNLFGEIDKPYRQLKRDDTTCYDLLR